MIDNQFKVEVKFNIDGIRKGRYATIDTGATLTVISANLIYTPKEIGRKEKEDRFSKQKKTWIGIDGIRQEFYKCKVEDLYIDTCYLGNEEILVSYTTDNNFLVGMDLLKQFNILMYQDIKDMKYTMLLGKISDKDNFLT